LTIQVGDRLLGALRRGHLDEAEAARLTGHPVEHQGDLSDLSARCKPLRDQIFGGVKWQVANVQTITHD
jgi:hypothetical protein